MPPRVLGGEQARLDASDVASKFDAFHISLPARHDLEQQTQTALMEAELDAEKLMAEEDFEVSAKVVVPVGSVEDATEDGLFSRQQISVLGPLAEAGARGNAAAHVALWKKCAQGEKACMIIEDGIKTWPRIGQIAAHLIGTIERVVEADARSVLLYIGGEVQPSDWTAQWLPTDMAHPPPIDQKIVLREARAVAGSHCYVVWPLAAKRLLANLPITMPIDKVIETHLKAGRVRAMVVQPHSLAVQVRDHQSGPARPSF